MKIVIEEMLIIGKTLLESLSIQHSRRLAASQVIKVSQPEDKRI